MGDPMNALKYLQDLAATALDEKLDEKLAQLQAALKAAEGANESATRDLMALTVPLLHSLRKSPPPELAPLLAAAEFFGDPLQHWQIADGSFKIRGGENCGWLQIPLTDEQQALVDRVPPLSAAQWEASRAVLHAERDIEWFEQRRRTGYFSTVGVEKATLAELIRAKDSRLNTAGMGWHYNEGWAQNLSMAVQTAMDAAVNEWTNERERAHAAHGAACAEVSRSKRVALEPIYDRVVATVEATPEFTALAAALEPLSEGIVASVGFRREQVMIRLKGLDGEGADPVLHSWPLESAPGADAIAEYWTTYDSFTQPKWTFRDAPTKSEVFAAMVERQDPALFAALGVS